MDTSEQQLEPGRKPRARIDTEDAEAGKIRRVSREARGLVEDVKSWVELRMTLTQMDVEERIDARINRAVTGAIVAAIGLLGLTFMLVAASHALGTLLGHRGWGFLIVGGVLLLISLLLLAIKPRIVSVSSDNSKSGSTNG